MFVKSASRRLPVAGRQPEGEHAVTISHPRLQPGIEFIPLSHDSALLRSFAGTLMLSGEFVVAELPRLLPMLDGTRTVETLLANLGQDYQPELEELLRLMESKGLIVAGTDGNGSSSAHSGERSYWMLDGGDASAAAARLADAAVVLAGLGAVGVAVAGELAACGVGRLTLVDPAAVGPDDVPAGYAPGDVGRARVEVALPAPAPSRRTSVTGVMAAVDAVPGWEQMVEEASLVVHCGDAMTMAGYACTNAACIRTGTPWVSARIDRRRAILGPFVIPGQTPCFTCFELRARANADHPGDHEALYSHWKRSVQPPAGWPLLPPVASIVGGMLALDVVRVLGGGHRSAMAGRILDIDLQTFTIRSHEILKLPRCPDCSRVTTRPLGKIWDITPQLAE
jgi:bacteriocin biosynthesis cyclodehydratase domain-containing protein